MTDKKIDSLFAKQDIKLSSAFNEALFAKIETQDSTIDELFLEDKLSLKPSFNEEVLDDARIEEFLSADKVCLDDDFCNSIFAKLAEKEAPKKRNVWSIFAKVSTVAAAFIAGIFIFNDLPSDELLDTNSAMYQTAKENINIEIDYFLLEADINELSTQIDKLEVALLEEIESYYSSTNI
ncbi:MAG: hypothetical protein R3Y46_03955 [Opitutales bacterium]